MSAEISFQKISSLWQNSTSSLKKSSGALPLDETVFNLDIADDGRAFFFFTNRKGLRLELEDVLADSSPLGIALERMRQQQGNLFSWDDAEDEAIFLDRNLDFAYQLFKGERTFLYKNTTVSNAQNEERASVVLKLIPDGTFAADFSGVKFDFNFYLKTENDLLEKPVPLTANYVLCDGKIFKTRDLGVNYNYLLFFEGSCGGDAVEQYLSLFTSIFPSIKIRMDGWSETVHSKVCAESALNFTGLDDYGNLSVSILWTYEPYPGEFISQNKPSMLIKLNAENRVIEKIPVLYDGSEGWKKMNSMLKASLSRHPECKAEGTSAYTIEGETLYMASDFALHFLSENLSELASNYRLFGTESIKKFKLKTVRPNTRLRIGSGIDFFDTQCEVDIDGEVMSPAKLVELYEKNKYIPLSDGSRAIIDRTFFLRLKRLLGKQQKDGSYKISFFDLPLVDSLINAKVENTDGSSHAWEKFYSGFNSIDDLPLKDMPLTDVLRDYQKYGVKWLSYLMENNLGACLADDMGLGKTIQTIALLASAYSDSHKSNSLIVVPKSLIDNWISELKRFAPELDVCAYYGPERNLKEALGHTVILTTYAIMRNDIEDLQKEEFEYAVLDEVQQIKNIQSQSSKAVMLLNARHRIALSGTPMENNLTELYSIFRFLNPSMFGSEGEFNRRYGNPIQKDGDEDAAKELGAKIRPFILRRLKQEVAKELPERTEQIIYVDMGEEQAKLYEKQRRFYRDMIENEISKNGFEKSQFCILQGFTELRQIATVPESKTDGEVESAKWQTLVETISEISSSGHRCLVFSNFLASIDAMSSRLEQSGILHLVMTGATSNRAELVKKFQEDETYKVFLMTLKTGGVGLNLTGADYVFILDPWWNKSAEQQAIDRTHRIGQTKNVFCYRLIARNTIEEKIMELQQQKSDLFSAVISSDGTQIKKLSEEDINYLLRD